MHSNFISIESSVKISLKPQYLNKKLGYFVKAQSFYRYLSIMKMFQTFNSLRKINICTFNLISTFQFKANSLLLRNENYFNLYHITRIYFSFDQVYLILKQKCYWTLISFQIPTLTSGHSERK